MFDIFRTAGIKHQNADALSRLLTSEENNSPLEDEFPLFAINTMHNLGDTHICVIVNTKDDVTPLDCNNTGVLLDTPPI